VFTAVRALQSDASFSARAVGIAIPTALALTIFAGAIAIVIYGLTDQALRIAVWTVGGARVVTFAVVLNIVGLELVRQDFTLALHMLTTAAAAGATMGVLIGLYDAHQQEIQANLAETRDRSQQLSQRLSVLNRVLRHDIRTQTQLLYGYTDRMASGEMAPDLAATEIREITDGLVGLSEDAQQLQKLFDGVDIDTETLDLVTLFKEAADNVQRTHGALTVEYDIPERQLVQAPPMLGQAIEQLLQNVVEHTETDDPRATVSIVKRKGWVELTVGDNGPGLPSIEMIHNTEESESQLHHSNGIGLWLVTWIVEEGGGRLDIETDPDAEFSTVVTVELPTA
jgi:signal transduction histidine kinase